MFSARTFIRPPAAKSVRGQEVGSLDLLSPSQMADDVTLTCCCFCCFRGEQPETSLRTCSGQEMLSVRVLTRSCWTIWTIWSRRASPACMNNEIKQPGSQLCELMALCSPGNEALARPPADSRPSAGLSGINQTPGRRRKHISVSGLWRENKPRKQRNNSIVSPL